MTVLNGIAYGMVFSVVPTIVSETFRAEDFGQNWGWMVIAAALASFAFNAAAGTFYDRAIKTHGKPFPTDGNGDPDQNSCVGV